MEFFFNPATGRVEQRQVNNNLPFRSMTELASEINQFPFLPPSPTVPLDAFKNTVAPMAVNTGINNTTPAAMFLDNAGLPGIDTSFGVANEPDVEEEKKQSSGIANLFRTLLGFAVPGLNLLTGGFDGIRSLNKRLRNTDFARSSTGAEYFQKRRDRKAREDAAARGAAKQKAITQRQAAPGFSGSGTAAEMGSF
tara:strand:+ start:96 stop:680 length:585 start_codon:yes stop_codon:yes gene_type:complete